MAKIKVMLFIGQLSVGGAERFTCNLANSLDKSIFDVIVVSWAPIEGYILDECVCKIFLIQPNAFNFFKVIGKTRKFFYKILPKAKKPGNTSKKQSGKQNGIIQLIEETKTGFFYRFSLASLKHLLSKEKPDIVFSCLHDCNELVVEAAKGTNSKIIISERVFPGRIVPFDFVLHGRLYSFADLVVVNSFAIRDFLRDSFNFFCDKFVAIHNPVDFDRVLLLGKEKLEHRFFFENVPVVVSCGRLDFQKAFDVLLESFVLVREKIDCRLVVLGDGVLHNDLIALRDELGLKDCVDFVGWQDNPFKFFSNADLFVLSSRFEGFPNVLLEAMCFGLPAISTDCSSGPKEIITSNQNGVLVPVNDVNALSDAILAVLSCKKFREKIGKNAVQTAKNFDLKKTAKQFEKLFIDLAKK